MSPFVSVIVVIVAVLAVAVVVFTLRARRTRRLDEEAAQAEIEAIPLMSEQDIAYRIGLEDRPTELLEGSALAAAAAAVSTAAVAPSPAPVAARPIVAGPVAAASTAPPVPVSRRYRLWRASAAVLLVVCVVVLVVTLVAPGFLSAPGPTQPADIGLVTAPTSTPLPVAT